MLGSIWRSGDVFHHLGELLEGDLTVTVGVNLLDNLSNNLLVKILTESQNLLDLVGRNGASTIFIEHFESSLKLVVAEQGLLVHCGNDELRVVDGSGTVGIDLLEHLIDLLVVEGSTEVLSETLLDLVLGELTVTIDIHGSEDLVDLLLLLLVQQLTRDESVSSLLQLGVGVEGLQVGQGVHGDVGGDRFVLELVGLLDPWVLQGLLGGWSLVLVQREKLGDEIFGLVGNSSPNRVSEGELTLLNLLHDLLVTGTVEWWDTGQGNVSNDTARPDVAFGSVVLGQNLWCNVVRCTKFFIEFFLVVKHERGSKIDDLNLVKLLVLLEQNVLRLQVSVDDVITVAVVDARKNLLHKKGGVLL